MTLSIDRNTDTWLDVSWQFTGVQPEALLRWFLEPEKIARWWAPESSINPQPGGEWLITFPQIDSTLIGEIAELTPTSMIVSWAFTHEPTLPARMIRVRTEQVDGGSLLRILQGPYRQSDTFPTEAEDRAGHIEGWEFFLSKLENALDA